MLSIPFCPSLKRLLKSAKSNKSLIAVFSTFSKSLYTLSLYDSCSLLGVTGKVPIGTSISTSAILDNEANASISLNLDKSLLIL